MSDNQSVIQTTAEAHKARLDDVIAVHRHMSLVTGCMPTQQDGIDVYCKGYAEGWAMATYFILQHGNCRFEKE